MLIALSQLQLLAGTEELFLNKQKKTMQYVTGNTRNMFLWKVCNEYKIKAHIERVWLPSIQRKRDSTIMDMLIDQGVFYQCLWIMNKCRIYLRLLYVSDIVSADGRIVLKWATHPKNTTQRRSTLK